MSKEEKEYDLEGRLIDFAVRIIDLGRSLPKTKVGRRTNCSLWNISSSKLR